MNLQRNTMAGISAPQLGINKRVIGRRVQAAIKILELSNRFKY